MTRKSSYVVVGCVVVLAVAVGIGYLRFNDETAKAPMGPSVGPGNFTLSGPYTHDNLTVFLIHGADRLPERNYLTLQEAMEAKKAVIHETENVSQLRVENLSPGEDVFIQAGDIVKGGKQDRTLEYDLVVPPSSGQVPLASLCVENSRWQKRGKESLFAFSSSSSSLSSKELKIAARYKKNQSEVWAKVAETQNKLAQNVGEGARSKESASSLQLTLESEAVLDATRPYATTLAAVAEGKNDVLGYAFVVNGKVNSAEVYGSSVLFRKLWPKLLRASAVESLAARKPEEAYESVPMATLQAFLRDAESGNTIEKASSDRVERITQETSKFILFETREKGSTARWIHRTYLTK